MTYDDLMQRLRRALDQDLAAPDLVLRIHPDDYRDVLISAPIHYMPPINEPKFGPARVFVDPHTAIGKPVLLSAFRREL